MAGRQIVSILSNWAINKIINVPSGIQVREKIVAAGMRETMTNKNTDEPYHIPDAVWKQIEPLLPPEFSKPRGGRPRINDRKVMEAILCIFRAGWKWKSLPSSLGAPSTVRHRFKEWQNSGVFQRMWMAGLLTYDEMRALVWYGKKRELHHEE